MIVASPREREESQDNAVLSRALMIEIRDFRRKQSRQSPVPLMWKCFFLGGAGCTPKRARIDPVWIEIKHCVIELTLVRSCFVQAVEITKVLARLANDAG